MKRYSFSLMILLLSSITCCTPDTEGGDDSWPETTCPESPLFEPHTWPAPEHCDIYDSGRCCVFYTNDVNDRKCYDEWCKWDEGCGWEYSDNFCPLAINEQSIEFDVTQNKE